MGRKLLLTAVMLGLLPALLPARGTETKFHEPLVRIAKAGITAFGTVTAIEKDEIELPPKPGEPASRWTIAIVRIDRRIVGAENTTHLRVGFRTPPPNPESPWPTLKPGQQLCLFL